MLVNEKSKLMFDFEASEDLKEDLSKFTEKSAFMSTAKKCAVEAVGTFFLCSSIALTHGEPLAPLAIGLSLAVMVFAFGHISGGHFNPAVTLAVFIRGGIDYLSALSYTVAQLVGAFLGAAIQKEIFKAVVSEAQPATDIISFYPKSSAPFGTALICEAMFTFALAIVVLNVATTKAQEKNSFFGLAIGMTVMVGAVAVGGVSGGAFNPAVGIALPAVHGITEDLVLYVLGPCLGAATAAVFFRMTVDEKELKKE